MQSLAQFHVKRIESVLEKKFYTVSASKKCKDWKMHSLAKFHLKRPTLPKLTHFYAPATSKHWKMLKV